jgi:DNA-binding transcriptional MerR regulator
MARQSVRKKLTATSRQTTLVGRSALCLMTGISESQLILWEHEQLIEPVVTPYTDSSGEPLYDATALRRAQLIRTLAEDLEVNFAGIDVILNLLDQMAG